MANLYEQFLGSKPGIVVELVDDSASPFLVRTAAGFEFFVSAEDFRNYYREKSSRPLPVGALLSRTCKRNGGLPENGLVMEIIHSFEETLQDFEKARSVVRQLAKALEDNPAAHPDELFRKLAESGGDREGLTEQDVKRLVKAPRRSENCYVATTALRCRARTCLRRSPSKDLLRRKRQATRKRPT